MEVLPALTELINNFRPTEFTFDQYESAQTIQLLQENLRNMNISETQVFSIFATPKINEQRAKNFRTAINLGRVHAPHPMTFNPGARVNSIELARNELKFLQEKNGKVDKQTVGPIQTKDIADAMMAVTNALIGDTLANAFGNLQNAVPQLGAHGGYSLGSMGNTNLFPEMGSVYGHSSRQQRGFHPERGMHRQTYRRRK